MCFCAITARTSQPFARSRKSWPRKTSSHGWTKSKSARERHGNLRSEADRNIKSAAVFVGDSGLAPGRIRRFKLLLSQFMKRKCPVIPTVLANQSNAGAALDAAESSLGRLPRARTDALKQLVWGITGVKPAQQSSNNPSGFRTTDSVQRLVPPKK